MNVAVSPLEVNADSEGCHPLFRDVPSSVEFNKLRKRLLRHAREAIENFGMVRPGDRWLVALSGGKDSYGLLAVLLDLKWRGLLPVDLLACNLDQGQPNFPKHILPEFLDRYGIPHRIEYRDTYSIVTDKIAEGSTYCSLCSRLRRGHLYRIAREEGCSSLVLGHHREDVLETFFMNLFHGGRLAAMPPKLLNDEGDVDGAEAAGLLRRGRSCALCRRDAFPDHPVRPLRQPGRPAAQRDEGDDRRHRAQNAGPQGHDDPCARQCPPVASARRPRLRLPRSFTINGRDTHAL